MRGMILKDRVFNLGQGGLDRLQLCQDINTVPVFLDHAGDAGDLSADPVETMDDFLSVAVMFVAAHVGLILSRADDAVDKYPMGV